MIYRIENIASYTDKDYEKAYLNIPRSRQEKADRYKSERDRKLCVFAWIMLTDMLCEFCRCEESELEFVTSEKGKPGLADKRAHFNLSHSVDFIACAVDSSPVGIDIEVPRKADANLIRRVCTEEELDYVFAGGDKQVTNEYTDRRFLQIWTAKEAYLKYTGKGLAGGLESISVADKNGMKRTLLSNLKLFCQDEDEYILSAIKENNDR